MIAELKDKTLGERCIGISRLCGFFGVSRGGFYKYIPSEIDLGLKASAVLYRCRYIRESLPKAGTETLLSLCNEYFAEEFTISRDWLYDLLRANDMLLTRKRHIRPPRTTNGIVDHEFDDHLNTIPKYIPTDHCRLAVSDITYIKCKEGFVYLSLTMDGYSRIITGYSLQRTLSREGPLDALTQSVEFYKKYNYDVNGLIFHSDRGCQYVSKEMTGYEAKLGIITSVTQTGDPLHNAMAERLNGTIKNDWLYDYEAMTFEETKEAIDKVIQLYNNVRPHRSLGMRTPMQTLDPSHQNPLVKNEGFA